MNSPLDWNSRLYDVSLLIQEASSVLKWIILFVLMLHYMETQTTVFPPVTSFMLFHKSHFYSWTQNKGGKWEWLVSSVPYG